MGDDSHLIDVADKTLIEAYGAMVALLRKTGHSFHWKESHPHVSYSTRGDRGMAGQSATAENRSGIRGEYRTMIRHKDEDLRSEAGKIRKITAQIADRLFGIDQPIRVNYTGGEIRVEAGKPYIDPLDARANMKLRHMSQERLDRFTSVAHLASGMFAVEIDQDEPVKKLERFLAELPSNLPEAVFFAMAANLQPKGHAGRMGNIMKDLLGESAAPAAGPVAKKKIVRSAAK